MNLHLKLLDDLMRRLGWRFPVLVSWTALVGLSEGISVMLLLPLLSRVGIATGSSQGLVTGLVNKSLAFIGATEPLPILAVIVAVAGIQALLTIALNWWSVKLARHYQSRRQLEMFRAFMRARWGFIAARKAGEMTNAIVTESERLGRAFTISLSLVGSLVVALIYLILSLLIAWQVTVSLIVCAGVAALGMVGLYRRGYAAGKSLAPLDAELQSALNEQFAGAKFIKASGIDDRAATLIEPLLRQLEDANTFAGAAPGTVRGVLEFTGLVGLAIILVLAGEGMGVAAGNIVVVLALFGRLFPRLTAVQAQMHYLTGNLHAVEVVDQLQKAAEAEAERQDGSGETLRIALPAAASVRNLDVRFGERLVLDQINLTVPIPGVLAVVGRSGAGKSTLVHTLLGLVDASAGSIRLGDYDLATAPLRAWRRAIGYVPQETILFHTSIRENLTLVKPNASPAEIETAARRAHAYEFIQAWPEGFDTIIGDQGVKLSGGQRQRLGIARALLTNPSLLLMDEAMSALDTESEAELMRTIEDLRKEMGILIVAHRLAAVRTANIICVLEAGRVVEAGTWNELMARRARLYALAEAQSLVQAPANGPALAAS
ncbi:MAG: ABC transporter ATP-binding protein [Xanthobacteraceae bacterium]